MISKKRITSRERRHDRLRKKTIGTSDRPRLNVFRSLNHLYAQVIDDMGNKVLVSASTLEKEFKKTCPRGGNIKASSLLAELLGKRIKEKGISKVVFDRGGYLFHGRVKTFADALRKQGLNF